MVIKVKKYWVIIAAIIVGNILIFSFLSRNLESFVADYTVTLDARTGL